MPAQRKQHQTTEYEKVLKQFHKTSRRHIFHDAELARKLGNRLTGIMKKRLEQLLRTKKYRALKRDYGKTAEAAKKENTSGEAKERVKMIGAEMSAMQEGYGVTRAALHLAMKDITLGACSASRPLMTYGGALNRSCTTGAKNCISGRGATCPACGQNRQAGVFPGNTPKMRS